MILIIAGSRGYHRDEYMPKLDEAIRLSGFKPTKIIHGAEMTSVDRLAREWARRNKLPEQGYPGGALTRGFKRMVAEALEGQVDLAWVRLVPDAFEVSPGLVVAYEVEDTHRVDRVKLRAYARLWSELDATEWEFRLVILDIRGGRLEPNLTEVYYHGHSLR